MLSRASATTMIPVVDLERARRFYEGALSLPAASMQPNGNAVYSLNGATVALYQRATPTTADHTALSFEVEDVRREMGALRERGVVFENYDLPGLKTEEGVCVLGSEKAAWFKDTEGNILCIHEDSKR
ncbi:MAG: VOC family protein [Deltaproteobacteria bacterium]|nr:VOC family protein [Deltaproteobacteria bacterium]